MKHLGDITKINGAAAPAVDIITGGSPCQDLSVVGKRAGLAGERSGLFMEQIRIIKEMRNAGTNNNRCPRYMVWENVPGAFSSNGGEDFRAVLEETVRVAEPGAVIPRLPEGQKWTSSGCILGDGWSVAWRVHDAQFWGVPQRRKRIALVADFGGDTAPEILFEHESVSGHTQPGGAARESSPGGSPGRAGASSVGCDLYNLAVTGDVGATLSATCGGGGTTGGQVLTFGISGFDSNAMKSNNPHSGIYKADTSRMLDLNGGSPACNQGGMAVVSIEGNGARPSHQGSGYSEEDVSFTLNSTEKHGVCAPTTIFGKETTPTLVAAISQKTGNTQDGLTVCYGLDRASFNQGQNAKFNFSIDTEKIGAQVAKGPGAVSVPTVRRLTPLECERLQGYPDGRTDIGEWIDTKGKKRQTTDGQRYKACGNSIALPFWEWLAGRMLAYVGEGATMASLFDGIGGFPLVFSRHGCRPVWASEIEEFPIAVTKRHFPEEG